MDDTDVYLPVPVLNQWEVFPQVPKQDNMACWYTSAFMVLLYRMGASSVVNLAHLDTLKRLFTNQGLGATEDEALSKELGLEFTPSAVLFSKRDKQEYCRALAHLGPLVFSEPMHVIVVRGCVARVTGEAAIVVNDPWGGKETSFSVADFNARIDWSYPVHYRRTRFEPPKVLRSGPNMHPYATKY
jgi:hypothetical protein